jgi:Holliday junction resolvase RusA-like endonuclease
MLWYGIHLNPEPWAVGPAGVSRRGGKLHAYVGRNEGLAAYQNAVKEELVSQKPMLHTGNVRLRLLFWRQLTGYEDTETGRRSTKNRPDVTNMLKAIEDACQGILFANDRQVIESHSVLMAVGPKVTGRVLIGVEDSDFLTDPFDLADEAYQRLLREEPKADPNELHARVDRLAWSDEGEPF